MKRMFAIAALTVVALCLTLTTVLLTRPTEKSITITVDDLARMKTLAHKYLNERYRLLITSDPDNNPNVAGAPVIDPSEMSPGLAARQREDVEKLKARRFELYDDFAIYLQVMDIRKEGDAIALIISDQSCCHMIYAGQDYYGGEGTDRYFKFARKGNGWMLLDVKLRYEGGMPPITEPSVEPREYDWPRCVHSDMAKIPEDIEKIDDEATEKILNEWAVNRQTLKTLFASGGSQYHSYIMGEIVQVTEATPSDKPDAICFIKVRESGSHTYPEALLAVTEETTIIDQHNDRSTVDALKEGQAVEVDFDIYSQDPWNANARLIEISP